MSNAPAESATNAWLHAFLVGTILGGVTYGLHVAVFTICLYHQVTGSSRRRAAMKWKDILLVSFIGILFTMGTINIVTSIMLASRIYVDNRQFPGGPEAWYVANYRNAIQTTGNVSYIISTFFTDGLLLWRTYAVWNTLWIMPFPILVYLGSISMSILAIFQSTRPGANLWTHTAVQFTLPYFSLSVSLNTILTLLLVTRLLHMSFRERDAVGMHHARTYNSIASMLVESAAPYTITGLIFIISYARNSTVQNVVLPILAQVVCINPELIVLRVLMGRDMNSTFFSTARRSRQESTLRFGRPQDESIVIVRETLRSTTLMESKAFSTPSASGVLTGTATVIEKSHDDDASA